jgi:hypothetical protein
MYHTWINSLGNSGGPEPFPFQGSKLVLFGSDLPKLSFIVSLLTPN